MHSPIFLLFLEKQLFYTNDLGVSKKIFYLRESFIKRVTQEGEDKKKSRHLWEKEKESCERKRRRRPSTVLCYLQGKKDITGGAIFIAAK